jgi:hypothetical protein
MTSRYLLALRDAGVPLGEDHRGPAGETRPRPFRLELVRHSKVWDMTREHAVTPQGVLLHGLREWVEVEPLSGRTLRSERADKLLRYQDGIEVRVRRDGEKKADVIEISRQGTTVRYPLPDETTARAADLRIGGGFVYCQTVPRSGTPKVLAIDAATGQPAWTADDPAADIYLTGPFLVAMKSQQDRTLITVLDAQNGKALLKKDLGTHGIWLEPAAWGNKLFLVDDVRWQLKLLDVASGEWDYERQFQATFPRGPLLHEGVLYIHERDYKGRTIHLHALDPATGVIRWSCDMKAMSVHSPPIFRDDDIVYLNPETHSVFLIDRRTGVRHSEAGYEKMLTKQQLDRIQFLRAFGKRLLLVGTYGDIHALELVPNR